MRNPWILAVVATVACTDTFVAPPSQNGLDGREGRRLWFFFDPPIALRHAHAVLVRLRLETGDQ